VARALGGRLIVRRRHDQCFGPKLKYEPEHRLELEILGRHERECHVKLRKRGQSQQRHGGIPAGNDGTWGEYVSGIAELERGAAGTLECRLGIVG
jgi:hypothetical protein